MTGYLAGLWLGRTLTTAAVAAILWLLLAPVPSPGPGLALAAPALARRPNRPARPESLAVTIARRNPFRAHRTAAIVRYRPDSPADAQEPPAPPQPTLTLVGLILGLDTAALVDGLPGTDGTRLLRTGDRVSGYTLHSVDQGGAILRGPDSTLSLSVRRPQ